MSFLAENEENANFNQYWYSALTIKTIVQELESFPIDTRICFLSTPSLYFSLTEERRSNCFVFDYDVKWQTDRGFVRYDFNESLSYPTSLVSSFDIVVIDPPFITKEVWEKYALTAKSLLKSSESKIILTTIHENASMMSDLLSVKPTIFMPSIPNLVYQYALYTNYNSELFSKKNPEIIE